jgi:hypothetical protein
MTDIIEREYKFVGQTGFETPWKPIPKDGLASARPTNELREKLGRTYGVSIRIKPGSLSPAKLD